jgi:MFS family permease
MQSAITANSDFPTDRNVALLYGFSAARSAMFLVAVLVPYFEDHVGLTFREILLTEAAFAATMVLAEVPSGWVADQWRRKSVLVIGAILWAVGILLLWTAEGFAQVVAGQVTMGLAASMHSGADSALLYGSLLCRGMQSQYLTLESRRHEIGLATLAAASAIAGPLFVWMPRSVFAFDFASFLLCGICAMLLREPPRQKTHRGRFNFAAMVIVVVRECFKNRVVLWAILLAGGLMAATKASIWTQQAYLRFLDIELFWFGPIAAMGFLIGGLASQLGPMMDRSIGPRAALGVIVTSVICGFAIGGVFPRPALIPLLFVGIAAYGIALPALKTMVNDLVESDRRATILSVLSLVPQLTFVGLSHYVGQIVDRSNAADGYIFLAGFTAVAAGCGWVGLVRSLGKSHELP